MTLYFESGIYYSGRAILTGLMSLRKPPGTSDESSGFLCLKLKREMMSNERDSLAHLVAVRTFYSKLIRTQDSSLTLKVTYVRPS